MSEHPWFDTPDGVAGYFFDLDSERGFRRLHALIRARRAHAQTQGDTTTDHLRELYVLNGRLYLDPRGGLSKVTIEPYSTAGKTQVELHAALPLVTTRDDLFATLMHLAPSKEYPDSADVSVSILGASIFPPEGARCPDCGGVFTIRQLWTVRSEHEFAHLSLGQYVGQPLRAVDADVTKPTDHSCFINWSDRPLRNDDRIDLTPDPHWAASKVESMRSTPTNRTGHYTPNSLDDLVREGDELTYQRFFWHHGECRQRAIDERTRTQFVEAFSKAGYERFEFTDRANAYGSRSYRGPWFTVETEIGIIVIGWRKRVVNIDYTATSACPDWSDQDTTYSGRWRQGEEHYVHAWPRPTEDVDGNPLGSWDRDIVMYLQRIREAASEEGA